MRRAVPTPRRKRALRAATALAACLGAAGWAGETALAQGVGAVAAANEDVLGTPPEAPRRQLELGLDVYFRERIETSQMGAGQFVFLDQTALTVWPNSDIVLDEYVYDPDRGAGAAALSVTRGMLRFIGGRISKASDVAIRTPDAVIAVRGAIVQVTVTDERTRVVHIAGEYTRVGDLVLARPMAIAEIARGESTPRFVGIGGPEATEAAYGPAPGEGDGGLGEGVDAEDFDAALDESGIIDQGSGDPLALALGPVSTRGERRPDLDAPRGQIIAGEAAQSAIDSRPGVPGAPAPEEPESADLVFPEAEPPTVRPEDFGPDAPPIPDLPAGPLASFSGALFQARDATGGGVAFPDAEARTTFVSAARESRPGVYPTVLALTDTTGMRLVEVPGFRVLEGAGTIDGRPADSVSFVDPGRLAVRALRSVGGAPDALALGFVGAPTPGAFWTAPAGPEIEVRRYGLTPDLFSRFESPLPPQLGETFADSGFADLILVSPAGASRVPAAPGTGGAEPAATRVGEPTAHAGKWMLGWLAFEGPNVAQSSGFSVLTAPVATGAGGQATLSGELVVSARLGATEAPGFGTVPLGALTGGGGTTTFGPAGELLVLGGGQFADDDPDLDAAQGSFERWSDAGPLGLIYTTTRVAALSSSTPVPDAGRAPRGESLTGGYAAGVAQSWRPAAAAAERLSEPFLIASDAGGGVRFAFDLAANGGAAEFSGLSGAAPSGAAITALRLNWGDGNGRDAVVSDKFFVLRDARGVSGGVSGQTLAISGDPVSAPAVSGSDARQTGFTGGLASFQVVGGGGIFPPGVDRDPAYLRWGWWAGEVRRDDDVADPLDAGRVDRVSLGTWVAGVQSTLASVEASSGVGRYVGFAAGHVVERTPQGEATFARGGRFAMSYDFRRREGTATVQGIVGQSPIAKVSAAEARAGEHFGGRFGGFEGPGSGKINGAFFTDGSDPTRATAGSFEFTARSPRGNEADVKGVFGADRIGALRPSPP